MRYRIFLIVIGILIFGQSAAADDETYTGFNQTLDDKYQLLVGAYFADVDSSYRGVKDDGKSTSSIDLEALGLDDDETQLYLQGRIRFSRRWRLDLTYFGTDRSASKGSNFNIDLPDGTIPVGVGTKTKFKTKVYAARVGYSFVRDERSEFGAGLGLYVADLDLGIKGTVAGAGGPGAGVTISENADVTAPLPTISLFGSYAFSDKLSAEARAAYFTLDYDKYDGQMWDAMASLDYRAFQHVSFGVGYAYWDADLDVDESSKEERYDVEFKGPLVYIRAGF
jgi:hypothetical protein